MKPLDYVEHRTYPHPTQPWVMAQSWQNLLFAHWPIAPEVLQPLLPANLPLDTFDGQAWVGVVPFFMRGISARGIVPLPGAANFLELNVRTYVTLNGRPGVYFFCLDASSRLAVEAARTIYALPYFNARMAATIEDERIRYTSNRIDKRGKPAMLDATYGPDGDVFTSKTGSIENWLTERYCLYTLNRRGHILRGEIHHQQWPLQPAVAEFRANTMAQAHSITLPNTPPLLHFARRLDVVVWLITRT